MIIIADSNIFMSALINPSGLTATLLAERKKIQYKNKKAVISRLQKAIRGDYHCKRKGYKKGKCG